MSRLLLSFELLNVLVAVTPLRQLQNFDDIFTQKRFYESWVCQVVLVICLFNLLTHVPAYEILSLTKLGMGWNTYNFVMHP